MRIFVFESLSVGPFGESEAASSPNVSLLREGHAMLNALASDLAAVDGIDVFTLVDDRFAQRFADVPYGVNFASQSAQRGACFDRLVATSDATIVIAPEIAGELAGLCRRVASGGGKLLGPTVDAVELLSDKHRTNEFLQQRGVPVCRGIRLDPGPFDRQSLSTIPLPAVVKPLDGAGSLDVLLLHSADELQPSDHARRLEAFATGVAASVAVLCGPSERCVLPSCSQRLSDDGRFAYLGGETPLDLNLDRRARTLAERAVAALPGLLGYVGVDLILGIDATGANDVVIEINPRLTTSYVGLRRLAESNLAQTLVDISAGRPVGALRFRPGRVEFDCNGVTRFAETTGAVVG